MIDHLNDTLFGYFSFLVFQLILHMISTKLRCIHIAGGHHQVTDILIFCGSLYTRIHKFTATFHQHFFLAVQCDDRTGTNQWADGHYKNTKPNQHQHRCTHQAFFLFTFKSSANNLLYFIHFEFPLVSPFIYMHQTGFHAPADYHSTDFRKKPLSLC